MAGLVTDRHRADENLRQVLLQGAGDTGVVVVDLRVGEFVQLGHLPGQRYVFLLFGVLATVCLPLFPSSKASGVRVHEARATHMRGQRSFALVRGSGVDTRVGRRKARRPTVCRTLVAHNEHIDTELSGARLRHVVQDVLVLGGHLGRFVNIGNIVDEVLG